MSQRACLAARAGLDRRRQHRARGAAARLRQKCGEGVSGTDSCDSRSGDLRGAAAPQSAAPMHSMRRVLASPAVLTQRHQAMPGSPVDAYTMPSTLARG